MTHAELIALAERWLRRTRHPVVLADVRANIVNEQPDVIAWTNSGFSRIVECKASRADFLRDARKWHRRDPKDGMGCERWYFAPAEVLRVDELPERWGLAEITGRSVRVVQKPGRFLIHNTRAERALLVSAIRRATEGWGRRIFGEVAPPLVDGDPHPSAARTIRELRAEIQKLRREVEAVRRSAS